MCDRRRILAAARWMLFDNNSYLQIEHAVKNLIMNSTVSSVVNCTLPSSQGPSATITVTWRIDRKGNASNSIVTCITNTASVFVKYTAVSKINKQEKIIEHDLSYVCKLNHCAREEVADSIIQIMWYKHGLEILLGSDNSVTTSATETLVSLDLSSVMTSSKIIPTATATSSGTSASANAAFQAILLIFLVLSE